MNITANSMQGITTLLATDPDATDAEAKEALDQYMQENDLVLVQGTNSKWVAEDAKYWSAIACTRYV